MRVKVKQFISMILLNQGKFKMAFEVGLMFFERALLLYIKKKLQYENQVLHGQVTLYE
jgi:hypothetical protein